MSLFRNFYYDVKPYLPFSLRLALRRAVARFQRRRSRGKWPILESAGLAPQGWRGWPNGKQFAFVLTHDVEGMRGFERCHELCALEESFGFRSSFNFIPEGSYNVRKEFLGEFVERRFEVGVHDLHHNGKLYRSKKRFDIAAPRINHYLREWNAVGFRSGFMHRNLEWLHALDISYDMSTFDTDPFEPQPDGAHTIFPFWVPAPASPQHSRPVRKAHKGSSVLACTQQVPKGYVELPYTLPQDSTIFLLLREKDSAIWKRKLDWIAERGGMALVNVHPDYIKFDREKSSAETYSVDHYKVLLDYVQDRYSGVAAFMLPKEVAELVQEHRATCLLT